MDRDRALLAALIRSAAQRAGRRTTLDLLIRHCWPGGTDRANPTAAAWLRSWGPTRTLVDSPRCGCDHGRCTACN